MMSHCNKNRCVTEQMLLTVSPTSPGRRKSLTGRTRNLAAQEGCHTRVRKGTGTGCFSLWDSMWMILRNLGGGNIFLKTSYQLYSCLSALNGRAAQVYTFNLIKLMFCSQLGKLSMWPKAWLCQTVGEAQINITAAL